MTGRWVWVAGSDSPMRVYLAHLDAWACVARRPRWAWSVPWGGRR